MIVGNSNQWSGIKECCINDLPGDVICNISVQAGGSTLNFKFNWASDMQQQQELTGNLESDFCNTGLVHDVAY